MGRKMVSKHWYTLGIFVIISALFCIGSYLFIKTDVRPSLVSSEDIYFEFIPDTILTPTQSNKSNAEFIEISEKRANSLSQKTNPVHWDQNDYYFVLQAIYEHLWQEPLEWNLDQMLYKLDCGDANKGPQIARFSFYNLQEGDSNKVEMRFERNIWIKPESKIIIINEDVYVGNIKGEQSIDMRVIDFPVEDVLKIAEENGGAVIRSLKGNDCQINIVLPSEKGNIWKVFYSNYSDKLFDMRIDAITGEFEILESDVPIN